MRIIINREKLAKKDKEPLLSPGERHFSLMDYPFSAIWILKDIEECPIDRFFLVQPRKSATQSCFWVTRIYLMPGPHRIVRFKGLQINFLHHSAALIFLKIFIIRNNHILHAPFLNELPYPALATLAP